MGQSMSNLASDFSRCTLRLVEMQSVRFKVPWMKEHYALIYCTVLYLYCYKQSRNVCIVIIMDNKCYCSFGCTVLAIASLLVIKDREEMSVTLDVGRRVGMDEREGDGNREGKWKETMKML